MRLNVFWGTVRSWTANWGHRWLDIYSLWRTRTWWSDRQKSVCVCMTKCDSFQCMLMRVWTLCDVVSSACDSYQNKNAKSCKPLLWDILCTRDTGFIYRTIQDIWVVYLFSALVRFPVHSFTSKGHSHGHSHSFCSILRIKGPNAEIKLFAGQQIATLHARYLLNLLLSYDTT